MIASWIQLLRPVHWVKNLFVLAPLLFAQQLFASEMLCASFIAFGLFCLLSSSVYIINDIVDAPLDRTHPLKSNRPVASGRITPGWATVVGVLLALVSLAAGFALSPGFGFLGAGYLVLNLAYSLWLKKIAFIDVAIIAGGFVLRVIAGAVAIGVVFSTWLVVCTFCLACLLALGKRRHELQVHGGSEKGSRPALAGYSPASLKVAERILAIVTLLCYVAYTLAPGTREKFGTCYLFFSLPFPVFGILRYLRLVETRQNKAPTEVLVTDLPSVINLAGWVLCIVWILYDVS